LISVKGLGREIKFTYVVTAIFHVLKCENILKKLYLLKFSGEFSLRPSVASYRFNFSQNDPVPLRKKVNNKKSWFL